MSILVILNGKRELVALLGLSSWCFVIVVWLFLAVPWVCRQFVIVVFPDHTYYFCRMLQGEHFAILSTFIKLPFVIKIFVLSIFEWLFYTGFTVYFMGQR